jgi:hypothetical protein
MSEEDVDPTAPVPEAEDDTDADVELAAEVSQDANGDKRVKLGTMLKYKKEARELGKKIKDYETRLARQQDIDDRLNEIAPKVNAILNNAKMKAEYLRMQSGTLAPPSDDDPEAQEWAEESGLYMPDGQTLNVTLARKQINRISAIAERKAGDTMRPWAALSMNDKADTNIQAAMNKRDPHGNLMATPESIQETIQAIGTQGKHLLANPDVVTLIVRTAAGIDREKGRSPKEPDEPLYIASAGGRSRNAPAIDAQTRAALKRMGLTDEEYQNSSKGLEDAARSGTAYILGGGKA